MIEGLNPHSSREGRRWVGKRTGETRRLSAYINIISVQGACTDYDPALCANVLDSLERGHPKPLTYTSAT